MTAKVPRAEEIGREDVDETREGVDRVPDAAPPVLAGAMLGVDEPSLVQPLEVVASNDDSPLLKFAAAPAPRPEPLYLVADGHTCAAWWHAPTTSHERPLAVVLAGSWGDEDLVLHDSVRALAVRLAEAGFGVVRLEWPDMGDSSAASGSTGVAEALAALDAAALAARSLSGRGRLAVAGVRIGALLAAHAAASRRDVETLVAIAPVGSGGSFLRDLATTRHDGPASLAGSSMRLGGFSLPEARAMELAALQWPTAGAGGMARALVVGAMRPVSDRPSADASLREHGAASPCFEALARLGVHVVAPAEAADAEVHRADAPPFASSVDHPGIVAWLAEHAPARLPRALPAATAADVAAHGGHAWLRTSALGVRVREQICRVAMPRANGELSLPLVAVLTERDLAVDDAAMFGGDGVRRGVVLVSTAGGRRVGPHRLWTSFARERAARGEIVLRIDLAGTGDSDARTAHDPDACPQPYDSRCVDDIARAIAWLRRDRGVGACTVVGLGTGAHHAWRAAVLGIDLQHVVAINPGVFHWPPEPSAGEALAQFGEASGWRALPGVASLRRRVKALEARADKVSRSLGREIARAFGWRLVDDLASELALIARRGVAVDFVFSRGEPGLATLREEAGRTGRELVRAGALRILELVPREPTFASPDARAVLVARLHALLSGVSGSGAEPATDPAAGVPAGGRGD